MCGCDDSIPPDFVNVTYPVARKRHVCEECRRDINAGDRYERASGKWDGKVSSFATCARCARLRSLWVSCPWGMTSCAPPYGSLFECIREERADRAYRRRTAPVRGFMRGMRRLTGSQPWATASDWRERAGQTCCTRRLHDEEDLVAWSAKLRPSECGVYIPSSTDVSLEDVAFIRDVNFTKRSGT